MRAKHQRGLQKFAHFGPDEQHNKAAGGFCISAFALVKKGDRVLLLKPKTDPRWTEEWAPNWRVYAPEKMEADMRCWRFPSSYVKEGEAPADALARVMKDQLGFKRYNVRRSKLLNFYSPSTRRPGQMHWDYCFVFWVTTASTPKVQPWLEDVRYVSVKGLRPEDLGSAQGDLAKALNIS
jgi:ADP-ribose pyrophosphatase YjhB (NUDIX family)